MAFRYLLSGQIIGNNKLKNNMYMKNIKTILCGGLVAMLVSCSPQVTTTNYYFDSVNGDDANNGTSVRTPFKF